MSYTKYLPSNRAVLFANLSQALANGEKFPELFESAADISPGCYSKPLLQLATAIREQSQVPLLIHIKEAAVFLPWEVRFIQLGLATLKIGEVFARLCDYYALIAGISKYFLLWFVGFWCLLGLTGAYLGANLVADKSSVSVGFAATVLTLAFGWFVLPGILQQWIVPNSVVWQFAVYLPRMRSLVVARSVYQYLLNLGLCVQSGMDLSRSLKVSAKSEPIDWLRQRYLGVAEDVAAGAPISKAFIGSGILSETRIVVSTDAGGKKPGNLWEPGITDVVRQSFSQQLEFAAKILPLGLMLIFAVTWLILAMVFY